MTMLIPCLYSFRRCPYAMRARLGLLFSGLSVELREIVLKDKPDQMLAISPKGTVPVLQLIDGSVIEESLEIALWALSYQDPYGLLDIQDFNQAKVLIEQNDNDFKYWLNRYKYADRYLEMTQEDYRQRSEVFLQILESLLTKSPFLLGSRATIADISIMPFIRQFAHVDKNIFYNMPYPNLQAWLQNWLEHPFFLKSMIKFTPWQEGDDVIIFSA